MCKIYKVEKTRIVVSFVASAATFLVNQSKKTTQLRDGQFFRVVVNHGRTTKARA